jgi:hypothetical protein
MVKRTAPSRGTVFLNIPYDERFRNLYVAYVVGVMYLGFEPRATLGISGGTPRLDKIFAEIKKCAFSIHDLSRVELDRKPPYSTPRFNMPFELGLAVAWSKEAAGKAHKWFVFESRPYRIQKSLSDLNGSDPNIHDGTVKGVLRELNNAFVRTHNRPSVPDMLQAYQLVSRRLKAIVEDAGAKSLFEASAFQSLCFAAKAASETVRRQRAL